MMAGSHPSEIELFEEVEGELEPEQSAELRAHLETCQACSASVADLVQAREVLRASPLLESPAARVDAMIATFPKPERERRAPAEPAGSPPGRCDSRRARSGRNRGHGDDAMGRRLERRPNSCRRGGGPRGCCRAAGARAGGSGRRQRSRASSGRGRSEEPLHLAEPAPAEAPPPPPASEEAPPGTDATDTDHRVAERAHPGRERKRNARRSRRPTRPAWLLGAGARRDRRSR